ncbi:MAG: type IX secretion system protein PorQ [Bacteroidia bacterium]|nr:type IX secretion system protein PorQ [Bacteroidia bacterium]
MKYICLIISFLFGIAYAQIGGQHTFDFLNLSPSARLNALGGTNVSLSDDDPVMAHENPALLNDSMNNWASLSYSPYLAGIKYGYTSYATKIENVGMFHAGVKYFNSGTQQGADAFGNLTNTFSSNEAVLVVGYARPWKNFSYGANVKFIASNLAPGFSSTGLAFDLGGAYVSDSGLFSAGLVLRNMGVQLSTYSPNGVREPLPFQIVAGVSNKLKYMPLRFSVTFIQLEHPNLVFDDPNAEVELDLNGNPIDNSPGVADRIARHLVFGGEFLLGKSLRLRVGYNHLRRQELRSENRGGMSGFNLGVGIRANKRGFAFDYGYSSLGSSGLFNAHQFSLRYRIKRK